MADLGAFTDREGMWRVEGGRGRRGGQKGWSPGARAGGCGEPSLPGSKALKALSQEIGEAVEGF